MAASRILFKKFGAKTAIFTTAGFTTAGMYDITTNPAQSDVGIRNQPVARSVYSTSSINLSEIDVDDSSAHSKDVLAGIGLPEVAVIRNKLEKAPITEIETESAISTLIERPQILEPVFNTVAPNTHVDLFRVMDAVRNIINDQELVAATLQKIEDKTNKQQQKIELHSKVVALSSSSNADWNKLADNHCCAFCRDVFAAPHILECKHSFCWSCLDDYLTSCASEDSSVNIEFRCPECREEIKKEATHELCYDNMICKEVDQIADCIEKDNWKEKKQRFENHKAKVNKDTNLQNEEDRLEQEEEDKDWEMIVTVIVPIVTMITILIIVRCRS